MNKERQKMNGKIQHYFQDKGETNDQRREKKLVRMIGKNWSIGDENNQ